MTVNTKTSILISSQVPGFVREDHPLFVAFLEAYYAFLEQDGNVLDRSKNLRNYFDVDASVDIFTQHIYSMFLEALPDNTVADKNLILKHVKDFYRARGTEKSVQFILRAVFGSEADFYLPKNDILRVSDGKWYIEKALRITDTKINWVQNTSPFVLNPFVSKRIIGNTTNSSATVERINKYYQNGILINELTISSVSGTFADGEVIRAYFAEDNQTKMITANIFGGIVNSITIGNSGSLYKVGDPVIINSNTGFGANAIVSSVSSGNVAAISVLNGGAGFRTNDAVLITGGGGSGANASVLAVIPDNTYHPNSYSIDASTISLEANTLLGNAVYTNLNSANANTAIGNAIPYFTYSNTGPIQLILVINPGANYISVPNIDIQSNTVIRSLGILGRMAINNTGTGYSNTDTIEFFNVAGGYGFGAKANLVVDATGSIVKTQFIPVTGFPIGGLGFTQSALPTANIVTSTGVGANVTVTAILGDGESLVSSATTLGSIQTITIVSGGQNYINATIDLTKSGDGTATANAIIVQGVITYPGRYLNDDGFLSSYNFLENRDYYQNFSYVVRIKQSLDSYKK